MKKHSFEDEIFSINHDALNPSQVAKSTQKSTKNSLGAKIFVFQKHSKYMKNSRLFPLVVPKKLDRLHALFTRIPE